MNIKLFIYLIVLPIVMWSISSLRIEGIFKKNSVNQIKIMYFFLSLMITYTVTQFIYDLYQITTFTN